MSLFILGVVVGIVGAFLLSALTLCILAGMIRPRLRRRHIVLVARRE